MNAAHPVVIVVSLAIVGGAAWLAYERMQKPAMAPRSSAAELRAKAGPYISATKQLSEHEELSTLVVPSNIGAMLDQTCYIYKNKEFKQAIFTCPADAPIDARPVEP